MSEKSVLKAGPILGFSIFAIQDENGDPLRWEVRGTGGKLMGSRQSPLAARKLFDELADKVRNGLLPNGGGSAQEQVDLVDPSEPDDVDAPR